MNTNKTPPPSVPISYVILLLDIAESYGIERSILLKGAGIAPESLDDHDARISLLGDYAKLCRLALKLTREPSLAYEFGFRSTLTTHGILGFGLMSQRTIRDAFEFASKFGAVLRMPAWSLSFSITDEYAVITGTEAVSHGDLRRFSCEQLLVSAASIVYHLLPDHPDIELYFEHEMPSYHARYANWMPTTFFSSGKTEIRIPAKYLDVAIRGADLVAAKLAERECERELEKIKKEDNVVEQVRSMLAECGLSFPTQSEVANLLCKSSRTLSRNLAEHGTSYRLLLTEAHMRAAIMLLEYKNLSVQDVSEKIGYSSSANFSRAFKAWSGVSPKNFQRS
ncbi:MAG: AraC family transcriptional regulator ligand-binding domain-containing protein [Moraxellaceae bacterium]|nr:AraC family transcriptional regulator ligand-binding domain-containing protein [Moraxellaceae bacterium]MDZ4387720.1 AraC family transcriptional regulator ligand-binding domain-containing protein [Moraxellaceae bacterium]